MSDRCPQCGASPTQMATAHRRARIAEEQYRAEAARHAVTQANFDLYKLEHEGRRSWEQSKVRAQAKQIADLNQRLLAFEQRTGKKAAEQ